MWVDRVLSVYIERKIMATTEIKITGQDYLVAFDLGLVTKQEVRVLFGLTPEIAEGDTK
jgi:hypothetical protein